MERAPREHSTKRAGAGTSAADHRANVTGIYTTGSYREIFRLLRACRPNARRVGTLFFPSEVNTVFHKAKCVAPALSNGTWKSRARRSPTS